MFTRQTRFSLHTLFEMLDGEVVHLYPRCLLVNEIGCIACTNSPEAARAREYLQMLLVAEGDEETDRLRYIAYKYCTECMSNDPAIFRAVQVFEALPENVALIRFYELRPA